MKRIFVTALASLLVMGLAGCTPSIDQSENTGGSIPVNQAEKAKESTSEGKPTGPLTESGDPISTQPRSDNGTAWDKIEGNQNTEVGAVKVFLQANATGDVKTVCQTLSPAVKGRVEDSGESCEVAMATSSVLIPSQMLENSTLEKDQQTDRGTTVRIQTSDNIYLVDTLESDGKWFVDPETFRIP